MIGIYKITNNINGKIYVGQSNNIQRRFLEHKNRGTISRIPVDIAMQKYGKENFSFEVVEECTIVQLNQKEMHWINYFNSVENGYNCSIGGEQQSVGNNNGRAILTDDEIKIIRTAYNSHERRKDVYEQFKDKIAFSSFAQIWDGTSWSHIMPEVLTEDNKRYCSKEATNEEKSCNAKLTDKEVINIRKRYAIENAKTIYKDYKNRCSYSTLQQILWGRTYKHLPIYKKKEKKWINK